MNARTLALPALLFCAALTSACTTMPPQPASNLPVFLQFERIETQHKNLDRYACGNGAPLYCSCPSALRSATCRCGCPTL